MASFLEERGRRTGRWREEVDQMEIYSSAYMCVYRDRERERVWVRV